MTIPLENWNQMVQLLRELGLAGLSSQVVSMYCLLNESNWMSGFPAYSTEIYLVHVSIVPASYNALKNTIKSVIFNGCRSPSFNPTQTWLWRGYIYRSDPLLNLRHFSFNTIFHFTSILEFHAIQLKCHHNLAVQGLTNILQFIIISVNLYQRRLSKSNYRGNMNFSKMGAVSLWTAKKLICIDRNVKIMVLFC